MNKKLAFFATGVLIAIMAAFSFSGQMSLPIIGSAQSIPSKTPELSDHFIYGSVFRHVATFIDRADELERQGGDGRAFRSQYARRAGLGDGYDQIIERIAVECLREIEAIDERVRPIVEAYRAQYPNGQVPHGQVPAPAPEELREMNKERNELILRKRDELRAEFGEEAFRRFHESVRTRMASGSALVFPAPRRTQ